MPRRKRETAPDPYLKVAEDAWHRLRSLRGAAPTIADAAPYTRRLLQRYANDLAIAMAALNESNPCPAPSAAP